MLNRRCHGYLTIATTWDRLPGTYTIACLLNIIASICVSALQKSHLLSDALMVQFENQCLNVEIPTCVFFLVSAGLLYCNLRAKCK